MHFKHLLLFRIYNFINLDLIKLQLILFSTLFSFQSLAQREIVLNTTGYGFDRTAENGINPEQWRYIKRFAALKHNGYDASVTTVRLHIQWEHYEPVAGDYQREKIVMAVKSILDLKPDMKVALHFAYMRSGYWNDNYFDMDDIAKSAQGMFIRNANAYTCPSIYSDFAISRYLSFVDDVMQQVQPYASRMLYVTMGNNSTEEYYVPTNIIDGVSFPGLYETKAMTSWRNKFLPLMYPGQTSVTWGKETYQLKNAPQPTDGNYDSEIGRDFHRFAGWGLLKLFKQFHQTVKNRNAAVKVLYFIADVGSIQGNTWHLQSSTLPLALELADGIYHTDGTDQYDLWKKIMGIDCIKGTFGNKIAAVEFDPVDLGQLVKGKGINANISNEWFPRAFRHGAEYLHIAMHHTDLEIQQLAPSIASCKVEFLNSDYQPPERSAPITVNIFPNVFTKQFLFESWKQSGGENYSATDKHPLSIKMTDIGYWDKIWNTENYLPCTFTIKASASQATTTVGAPVTLNISCSGPECDGARFIWNGNGTADNTGNSVVVNMPTQPGDYTYKVSSERSGCMPKSSNVTVNVSAPLPVKLIYFTAAKESRSALLNWATSEEENSESFEIERSTDGKNWIIIGKLPAGNKTDKVTSYFFTDKNPENGENLYRLKMTDYDKTFIYSRIVNMKFSGETKLVTYPNPVTDLLYITAENWKDVKAVMIVNNSGAIVYSSESPQQEINTAKLPSGTYVIRMIRLNGEQESIKFIKKQ